MILYDKLAAIMTCFYKLFATCILLISTSVYGQLGSGIIKDIQTKEGLPFATIYNVSKKQGTIANTQGEFTINQFALKDTIQISYLGYEPQLFMVNQLFTDSIIYLSPKTQLLPQFVVQSDNGYLYELMAACKPKKNSDKGVKSYYTLQTKVNSQLVEVLEAYYNGSFEGYDIADLKMKNGRVALAPFSNRFFSSSEGAQAMTNHTLFENNFMFPKSPFGMSIKKMKKRYSLQFENRYVSDTKHVIYVLNFSPVDTTGNYFNGTVWIDSTAQLVNKVFLNVTDAKMYPFAPIGSTKQIKQVDMQLTKTYQSVRGHHAIKSVDFSYDITYQTVQNSKIKANTSAVLYAYDYQNAFVLPQFYFSEGMYEDYRKINAIPYNPWFWENIDEFTTPVMKENSAFVSDSNTITGAQLFRKNKYFKTGFFEHPYVWWSADKRITFRTDYPGNQPNAMAGGMPTEKYNLLAQIMLDINVFKDSTQIITHTIYDPYESFYYYEFSKSGVAFLNMYFDLVEIHKRKLDKLIAGLTNVDEIITRYSQVQEELKRASNLFFKEVQHGTNRQKMEEWNAQIQAEIGIDNLTFFHVYDQLNQDK